MEIWLDTSNVNFVAYAHGLGILQGVTTNPTILAVSKVCPQELIGKLLEVQNGVVAIQVLSDDVEEMCKQAKMLSAISNRILVKIPVTQNGIRTIYALNQEGVPTLATAIFELHQALLAFKAGASYLAPYLGRIADTGKNPIQVISQMHAMKLHYGFNGKIMGAGIRELTTAMACIENGICAMTLSEKIFSELVQDYEPTLLALEKFSEDWSKSMWRGNGFLKECKF
jgi:TalC/MipB family fructose-6-phosphate aldolase